MPILRRSRKSTDMFVIVESMPFSMPDEEPVRTEDLSVVVELMLGVAAVWESGEMGWSDENEPNDRARIDDLRESAETLARDGWTGPIMCPLPMDRVLTVNKETV